MDMTNIDLTRILCPVAFSPSSQRLVEKAATLTTLYDSELRLFHSPCVEIVRLANRIRPDLIVMGIDRGRGPKGTFGTMNVCVMQFAPCPLLLVPANPVRAPRTNTLALLDRTAA